MTIYVVNEVCESEYGCTEVLCVFSSLAAAEKFVNEHQYKVGIAWLGHSIDSLTIEEFELDKPMEPAYTI